MISFDSLPIRIVLRSELPEPEGIDIAVDETGIRCTAFAAEALRRAVDEHNARETRVGHALPFAGFRVACPALRFHAPPEILS